MIQLWGVLFFVALIGMPSPCLAVRGIEPPSVSVPTQTCSELLHADFSEGQLKRFDRIEVRFADGKVIEARFAGMSGDSVLLIGSEGDQDDIPSRYAMGSVTEVAIPRAHYRPAWMAWGLVVGGLLGVVLTDEDAPGTATPLVDPRVSNGMLAAFGGAVLGSSLSLVIPMTDTYTCR